MDEIQRGQMYLAGLDPVVGCEQGGVRPVLVIQNNAGNRHARTVIVAAVTSRCKTGLPTHVALPAAGVLTKGSTAMLEQIRTVDKSRLLRLLGTLDRGTMRRVDVAIAVSLGLRGTADVMTLCGRCARTFRNDGGYEVTRVDPGQKSGESCAYCGSRAGYDYFVEKGTGAQ